MAKGNKKGETLSGLYLRIGLNYDELNQDFVNVEQTLSENVKKLNRQNSLIDLKAKIDLTQATDSTQRLRIQQEQLTRQIEIQKQKVKLYEVDWIAASKANGSASKQAEIAAIALQNQRLELARLSQQLKNISAQQKSLPKGDNSLLAGYKGIKGNVAGTIGSVTNALNGLNEASKSADSALMKSLDIIGSMPTAAGKVVTAFAAIPLVVKGIENSLLDMARPAISSGDSFYVMSRGMQISVKDMAQLSTICKVTGIEVNEVASSLRRLSASITKSDEKGNLATKTLQKYGASIKDINGNIKQGTALVGELSKAFANARALGKGSEFRDAVGGRFWSADFVTFLEDYEDNVELAGKIVKNGLANPKLAHSVQGELNAMNAQAEQLSGAFSSAFMPVANYIVPHLRRRMGELTTTIHENSEGIKNVGYRVGEVIDKVGGFTTAITKLTVETSKFMTQSTTTPISAIADKYINDESIKNFKDFQDKYRETISVNYKKALEYNNAIGYTGIGDLAFLAKEQQIWKKIAEERIIKDKEAKRAADNRAKAEKELAESLAERNSEESIERTKKYAEELEKVQRDLKFGDNNYKKAIDEIEKWHRETIQKAGTNWAERIKIEELYSAKLEQVRKKHTEEIDKLNQETSNILFDKTHSEYEKQIRDIEQWKDAQLKKASTAKEVAAIISNAAVKESRAFEQEIDKIRGKIQSLSEKIFEQENSQRSIDIYRAQKERAEYLQQGYPEEIVERWYRNALSKIGGNRDRDYRRTPKLKEYKMDVPDFYGQMQEKVSAQMQKQFGLQQQQALYTPMQQLQGQLVNAIAPLNQMTQSIFELSRTAGSIVQSLNARQQTQAQATQPPNITVSPSININLAGAYVFDNAMRAQLTDDIVTEVTDKIKEAVETAANRQNFSYARY